VRSVPEGGHQVWYQRPTGTRRPMGTLVVVLIVVLIIVLILRLI
jgi:hypothetical protein